MPTPPAKIDKPAPGTTGASAADPTATAIARLDGVKQLISDKKLDDADKALKSVEADKDKLPEGVRGQVAALRKSLDTARAAAKAIDSGPKPPDVNVAVPDK